MHPQSNPFLTRRTLLQAAGALAGSAATSHGLALSQAHGAHAAQKSAAGPQPGDRVFLTNEDSNTLTVIDPVRDEVMGAINLTSFDEDPRPPFRLVTGGVTPTHGEMIQKPLYHGAISIHGCAPSPDSRYFATCGRGTSNLYLVDTATLAVVGNQPNPLAGPTTRADVLTSGVLVGREPHEPTFTRTGREIWVALRGENRIAVIDVEKAHAESAGTAPRGSAIRGFIPTLPGPAMAWFTADGARAMVISQKVPRIQVFKVRYDDAGYSHAEPERMIDTTVQDRFGFAPFIRLAPTQREFWVSQKLADAVAVYDAGGVHALLDHVALGEKARPNHVEFVANRGGEVAYVSFGRIDDGGPGGVASSKIGIIDRSAPAGRRRVVGDFFSHGREAHGIWTDPSHSKLYIAHERDELPQTPNEGQTVCTVFDIADPIKPRFIRQIALGNLDLPSGKLRNKKSINLVYVRPGAQSATA